MINNNHFSLDNTTISVEREGPKQSLCCPTCKDYTIRRRDDFAKHVYKCRNPQDTDDEDTEPEETDNDSGMKTIYNHSIS